MGGIFGQVLGLTVAFSPWLLLAIFLIALASEFGVMIPYLMESVWLFSGYNVAIGVLAPGYLLLFCLAGLIGRQVGSSAVFHISWFGSPPLAVFYRKYLKPRISLFHIDNRLFRSLYRRIGTVFNRLNVHRQTATLIDAKTTKSIKLLGRRFRLSPLTVALGRFLWMRLPITIAMGATGQRASLIWGVAIFSIIWDGAYIIMGLLGGRGGLEPIQMLLYPLGMMVLISGLVFGIRRFYRSRTAGQTS